MSVKVVQVDLTSESNPAWGQTTKVDILQGLLGTGNLFDGTLIGLFTDPTVPTPLTAPDTFIVPVWTDYASLPLVANPATPEGTYGATEEFVSVDWESAGDANENVLGVFVKNADGDITICYGLFDEPINVQGIQTITVVLKLSIG